MHLLLSPGSPPSSLWVARTCPSATVRKAHASPAVGNLPEPSEVGVICLLSLPDTQTRAQTHRHTRPPPPRGSPMVGTSSGGAPLPVPATPRLCLAELLQPAASPNAETHPAASERLGTREPRCILWCQIATKITLEYPQELRGAASRYKEIGRSMGKAQHATAELEWADAGEVRQRREIQAV